MLADCKFNCHKKCAALVPKDCQGYSRYTAAHSSEYFHFVCARFAPSKVVVVVHGVP